MRTKTCTGECGRRLPLDEVNFALRNKVKRSYRSDCKDCYNKKKALRYFDDPSVRAEASKRMTAIRSRNRRFIAEFLLNKSCLDCGETDGIVLEFDHVRGVKLAGVSGLASGRASLEKIIQEIEKCEVVCANCHRRRTAKRAGWDAVYLDARRGTGITRSL